MDLQDFVEVGFNAGTVLEDFVFVAGELEAFAPFFDANDGDVGEFDLVGGLGG